MTTPLRALRVVIPARDEEGLLPVALASVAIARAALASERPGIRCSVTVALDRCTDGSASVVRAHPDVDPVVVDAGMVGAARRVGVRAATAGDDPRTTWIASTDADTRVPPDWLLVQADLADGGADLVVGTVEPDPPDLPAEVLAEWWARHTIAEGHPHVHGANLGIRLSTYLSVGGFEPRAVHEDVRLVARVAAEHGRVVATARLHAVTSGRLAGRAPRGFAAYLHDLPGA